MWPYPQHWDWQRVQSRTLTALMEMGEINYYRMLRLVPDLSRLPRHCVSRVPGCLELHLEVRHLWRYTSDLVLTYRFATQDEVQSEPQLNIRLYHDARSAEAISGILHGHGALDALDPQFTLHHKWILNRFLYKWLSYCLRRGHCFHCPSLSSAAQLQHAAVTS